MAGLLAADAAAEAEADAEAVGLEAVDDARTTELARLAGCLELEESGLESGATGRLGAPTPPAAEEVVGCDDECGLCSALSF